MIEKQENGYLFHEEDIAPLRELAREYNCVGYHGAFQGVGDVSQLLYSIYTGEIALIVLADDEAREAIDWLKEQSSQLQENRALAVTIYSIALQLQKALERIEATKRTPE